MNRSYSNLAEQVPSCWLEESKTQFARSGAYAIFGYKKVFCTQRTICVNATSQTFHVHEYSNVYWCPVPIHGVLNLLPQGSWAAWLGNVYEVCLKIWSSDSIKYLESSAKLQDSREGFRPGRCSIRAVPNAHWEARHLEAWITMLSLSRFLCTCIHPINGKTVSICLPSWCVWMHMGQGTLTSICFKTVFSKWMSLKIFWNCFSINKNKENIFSCIGWHKKTSFQKT